jgi:hypothetical protein
MGMKEVRKRLMADPAAAARIADNLAENYRGRGPG